MVRGPAPRSAGAYPNFNLHAFSPPELWHFHKLNKLPLREVLRRLKDAGMGSLPGGGGEILVDRVREAITVNKCLTDEWLEVHRTWHELGGRSTCTMMFGHVETLAGADRVVSSDCGSCRMKPAVSPRSSAGRSSREHTMAHLSPAGFLRIPAHAGHCPVYLDNIPNIQSSWVTQGLKVGQLALRFGANDMGSLMIEENVVASAGTVHYLTLEQIKNAIREAGYTPRQRNVFYELVSGS